MGLSGGNRNNLARTWRDYMRLGDFETAVFAGSKRRHHVPAPINRRLRSIGTATNDHPICSPVSSASPTQTPANDSA
ncbi:hypothetical protein [Schleiferilactobacillus harbinensis]